MYYFIFVPDITVSLLSLVVTACGLALFGVSLFVSWKLCWVPWRERGLLGNKQESLNYTDTEANDQEYSEEFLGQPTAYPDSSMKISHTSPDIPLDAKAGAKENCVHNVRMHRQITEPTSSARSVLWYLCKGNEWGQQKGQFLLPFCILNPKEKYMWVGWHSLPYCLTFPLFDGKLQCRASKDDIKVQIRRCLALPSLGAEPVIGDEVRKYKSEQREM